VHDEARSKGSGSLDTGEQALRLGLPLFVVSPSLLRPEPEGNALLIREGGREVTGATDLLEHLELRIPSERFPEAYAAEVAQRHAEIRANAKKKKVAPPEQPTLF
jgi:predicted Rossmann fold nucleotide-binding protein DprA/Smf involved in DNA uptake